MNKFDLKNWFEYHPPIVGGTQITRYKRMREAAFMFAEELYLMTCDCKEKELAIEKVRESIMWANAAIACNEDKEEPLTKTWQNVKKAEQVIKKVKENKPDLPKPPPDRVLSEDGKDKAPCNRFCYANCNDQHGGICLANNICKRRKPIKEE